MSYDPFHLFGPQAGGSTRHATRARLFISCPEGIALYETGADPTFLGLFSTPEELWAFLHSDHQQQMAEIEARQRREIKSRIWGTKRPTSTSTTSTPSLLSDLDLDL